MLAGERGPWRCHFAGECSRVCPKGVDPAKAIQLMKRELVFDYLHLWKQPCPAALAKVARRREAARRHPGGAAADDWRGSLKEPRTKKVEVERRR